MFGAGSNSLNTQDADWVGIILVQCGAEPHSIFLNRISKLFESPLCHETVTLIDNLENYDKTLDEKIAALDLYLNYYYVNSEGLTLDISDEYVSNPINVYRMLDRLYHISDMTRKFIDGDAWDKSIRENVNKLVLANNEL